MSARSLTERKLWTMFKSKSRVMVNVTRPKIMVVLERPCINYTFAKYEGPFSEDEPVMTSFSKVSQYEGQDHGFQIYGIIGMALS